MKIILAGGSGFIGTSLARTLIQGGYDVVILSRVPQPNSSTREIGWDATTVGPWLHEVDGSLALINLTGKNINCRHTPKNRLEIITSRVGSVQVLGEAVKACQKPPLVWIQCSALGFYGDTGDRPCDETCPAGNDFLGTTCASWEKAFNDLPLPQTRKVIFRQAPVLGKSGGVLKPLVNLTKKFMGGAAGNGKQYMSWIHQKDLNALFKKALEDENWSGPYNAVSPNPVTNAVFMKTLRRILSRPWSPPVPAFAVRIGAFLMGTDGSLALTSSRCTPTRLEKTGFQFRYVELGEALRDLLAN